MKNLGLYAKAVVAALVAALTVAYAALDGPDGEINDKEWVNIALAAVTALGVYAVPNAKRSEV
jgi:hypothetical protein